MELAFANFIFEDATVNNLSLLIFVCLISNDIESVFFMSKMILLVFVSRISKVIKKSYFKKTRLFSVFHSKFKNGSLMKIHRCTTVGVCDRRLLYVYECWMLKS